MKNFPDNFAAPVKLTLHFDPSKLAEGERPSIFYYDEGKKEWVEVGGTVSGDRITANVDHFTKFAVLAVGGPEKPEASFGDIAGHWAEAAIRQAVSSGIAKGYTDGTFKPNQTVTRAEFAVLLMNALKTEGAGASSTFADSSKIGAWAKQAVAQAVELGVVAGYPDGTYRPDAKITRAEMTVMIAKALKLTLETNAATGFADDAGIPVWAKGAAASLKKIGLLEGTGANRFGSDAQATRAEAVTIILRMLKQQS